MSADAVVVVLVAAPDEATAASLARTLVEERLAACVNVLPAVRSFYRWEGAIQDEAETLLLIKAQRARFDALAARIVALHPYDLPEVVALPLAAGLEAYCAWVVAESAPEAS